MPPILQPVLACGQKEGTDLSVFLNVEDSTYDAYIGVALLERVDADLELLGLEAPGEGKRVVDEKFGHWHDWNDQVVSMER